MSDAAYELRTPLTAIQTSNEVALRKAKLSLPEAKRLIEQNTIDIIKLKQLSDGLLQLASQANQVYELAPVSLQDAAAKAMNRVVDLAQVKDIAVRDEVPDIKVAANQQSLGQIIVTLLDNTVKYSGSNSTVTLDGYAKGITAPTAHVLKPIRPVMD